MTLAVPRPRVLRDYQNDAVKAVLHTWGGGINRTGVVLPTGSGKSTVIAKLAEIALRQHGQAVALVAHRAELLDQMAREFAAVAPDLPPVGLVQGARGTDYRAPVVAASVQTLARSADRIAELGRRRVILWDETHHIGAATYERTFDTMGGYDPGTYFCGFTATMRRDSGSPMRGLIKSIAFERSLRWAVDAGHLVMPYGLTVRIPELDLNKVKVSRGDFVDSELAEVMEAASPYIVQAILANAWHRRSIIFAASVDAARELATALTGAGLPSEAVTGDMHVTKDREPVYARFRSGMTRAIVTVAVLTEGADFPMCDCVVIAAPTRSGNKYSQMVGRGLRTYTETDPYGNIVYTKTSAVIMDLVGVSRVLSVISVSDLDCGAPVKAVELDGTEIEPDELEPEPEATGSGKPRTKREGPISMVSIDLLAPGKSDVLWLSTPGAGIPFIAPIRSPIVVFLHPMPDGTFRVGFMNTTGNSRVGDWIDDGRPWALDVATTIAENYLETRGYDLPRHTDSWRRTSKPSDGQLIMARRYGIEDYEIMSKARLSDEITVRRVAPYLDPA